MADLLLEGLTTLNHASSLLRCSHLKSEDIEQATGARFDSIPPFVLPTPTRDQANDHGSASIDVQKCDILLTSRCPMGLDIYKPARVEFELIRSTHRTLAPTGCTADFCQSGRATKILEPRVGRDRPSSEIKTEAEDFLRECHDMGIIETNNELNQRIEDALLQIEESSTQSTVACSDGHTVVGVGGGIWTQSSAELEYGLRAAWKNSKRCIMRSEHGKLSLCDLRHVTTSHEMAHKLVEYLMTAFNGGRIQPTVFVFPPRLPGRRGPIVWNEQLLAFAGYKDGDGSILGDPKNVDLTNAIIELGWQPPCPKSRWDILPLVVMADNDDPYMIELPPQLKRQVHITHPRYQKEFEQLDLRWILFPALSKLGFDIGGVQYTAAPFLGWFMDAEIGVRNLADTSRYNVLPDVTQALKLSDRPDVPLEDLPEYLRLAALSRAQTELNLAVYHSYELEKVMMVDTITASMSYMQFDDNYKRRTGHRLPADPYWLAPPQGSIVPLWHRGAAPNYQPKPMIARHVQDPVKAWRREHPEHEVKIVQGHTSSGQETSARQRVLIFTCSDGITAGKLGKRLHKRLSVKLRDRFNIQSPQVLDSLVLLRCDSNDTILIIASSTGRGEHPSNAKTFIKSNASSPKLASAPSFSIYGNGDSTHGDTYNAAADTIHQCMTDLGCVDILGSVYDGDTACQNPDWGSFNAWVQELEQCLRGHKTKEDQNSTSSRRLRKPPEPMLTATLLRKESCRPRGLTLVSFDVGDAQYNEMDHMKIVTPNSPKDVVQAMQLLGIEANTQLDFHPSDVSTFLERHVDLSLPFKTLNWYRHVAQLGEKEKAQMHTSTSLLVLNTLEKTPDTRVVEQILQDMPSIQPRHFSAASSRSYTKTQCGAGSTLDILVKHNPQGRFSDLWLGDAQIGDQVQFCLASSVVPNISHGSSAPLIVIATGSGMGPIRSLLQRRVVELQHNGRSVASGSLSLDRWVKGVDSFDSLTGVSDQEYGVSPSTSVSTSTCGTPCFSRLNSWDSVTTVSTVSQDDDSICESPSRNVSLFAGFKQQDHSMIESIIKPARDAGLFDCLELCPSNSEKRRIQDHILRQDVVPKIVRKLQHPTCLVYICANALAAAAAVENLSQVAGTDIRKLLGNRLVEEVFRT